MKPHVAAKCWYSCAHRSAYISKLAATEQEIVRTRMLQGRSNWYAPDAQSKPHIIIKRKIIEIPSEFNQRIEHLRGRDISNSGWCYFTIKETIVGFGKIARLDSEFADMSCDFWPIAEHPQRCRALCCRIQCNLSIQDGRDCGKESAALDAKSRVNAGFGGIYRRYLLTVKEKLNTSALLSKWAAMERSKSPGTTLIVLWPDSGRSWGSNDFSREYGDNDCHWTWRSNGGEESDWIWGI